MAQPVRHREKAGKLYPPAVQKMGSAQHGDGLYPFSEEFAGLRPLEPIHRSTFCTRARLAERFRVQAQRAAIARFAGAEGMTLIAE